MPSPTTPNNTRASRVQKREVTATLADNWRRNPPISRARAGKHGVM